MSFRLIFLAGAVLVLVAAPGASAQGRPGGGAGNQPVATAVTMVQPLQFGTLVPAITEQVTIGEAWRRGELRLEGSGNLEIRMVLPTQMTSTTGAVIPLTFALGDGGVLLDGTTQVTAFDPNQTVRVNFRKNAPGASLFLGGRALPATTQPAGSYRATVVVVLAPNNF